MNKYNHILAKSIENGGASLKSHIESVVYFAQIGAKHAGLNEDIAKKGALLHDIGKASPLFQKKLKGFRPNPLEMNFRHEIASILFLKTLDKTIWPQVIDMIIAHHKSIGKDGRELGILDLDYYYGDVVFQFHASDFEIWSIDALEILEELGVARVSISKEDAYEAYQFVLEYCKTRNKG